RTLRELESIAKIRCRRLEAEGALPTEDGDRRIVRGPCRRAEVGPGVGRPRCATRRRCERVARASEIVGSVGAHARLELLARLVDGQRSHGTDGERQGNGNEEAEHAWKAQLMARQ